MNRCAKFRGDSPKGKRGKFYLASAIEFSETADFVYNFVWKSKRATSAARLTKFFFEFCAIFTEDATLILLYHVAKGQR